MRDIIIVGDTTILSSFLMSRIEKDSEIIFCGDVAQIDHHKFEKNSPM